jgi:hypothetical protein
VVLSSKFCVSIGFFFPSPVSLLNPLIFKLYNLKKSYMTLKFMNQIPFISLNNRVY